MEAQNRTWVKTRDASNASVTAPHRQDIEAALMREKIKNNLLAQRNSDLVAQAGKLRTQLGEAVRKMLKLQETIHVDEKTGLNNERYLMDVSGPLFAATKRKYETQGSKLAAHENFIVIYIDVNGLKSINDNLGHAAGDILITTFAKALEKAFPRQSDIRIRKSGDEFVLILQGTDLLMSRAMLEKRFFEINESTVFIHDKREIHVRCGYGAVDYCGQTDFSEMLKEADILLYDNKIARKKLGLTTTVI